MDADELLKKCTEKATLSWEEHRKEVQRACDEQFASVMAPLLAAAHSTSSRVDQRVTKVFSAAFRHAMGLSSDATLAEMEAAGKDKIDHQLVQRLVSEYRKMLGT